ncbi:Alcohol acetyltransferase [Kalmusia sp. IMI 367209]|nr:Alcohol acetyltransferase [Kalmusia sp. IMI 367209]
MSKNVDSHKTVRPLGYNEQYELAQYTLGYHRGVSTTCRYAIPGDVTAHQDPQSNLKNVVYAAIARVVSDSPMLQVSIEGALSKKPVWAHINSVNLEHHVEWISLDGLANRQLVLQEKISSELDTVFSELGVGPGWRIVVLHHARINDLDVVFTWNHAHTDGMGGKIFHDKLLAALAAEQQNEAPPHTDNLKLDYPDAPSRFPPATEQFVKLPMSPGFLLRQGWNESKPTSLFQNPSEAKWAPVKTSPYKTQFRTCIIADSALSGILTACRSHKTTLTATLHGLALFSLARQLDEKAAPAFACLTAIDQRRFLPSHPPNYPWLEPSTTMANYVTNRTHEFDSALVAQVRSQLVNQSQEDRLSGDQLDLLWLVSSKVRQEIEKRLQKGLKNDRVGLMKFVSNARELFEKESRKPRALSWGISNLGVLDGTPKREANPSNEGQETWRISRAQFTLSAHIPDAALLIDAVSVKGGELVITCTWQNTVVETTLAERVVEDLKGWLTQIGEPSRSAP